MRINKYIAACGVCSRRKADKMIENGLVSVNGEQVFSFIDVSEADEVAVNGTKIALQKTKYYIALNKPEGFISTVSDDRGRKSVLELVSEIEARLFPVGRLDINTTGLLLLTNDGDFANKMMHPKNETVKTYIAAVTGHVTEAHMQKLRRGVLLSDGITAPAKAEIIKTYPNGCDMKLSIHEGRNRQVRRMFEALGLEVISLCRISVGNIMLGNLPLGKWRHLTRGELWQYLQS